MLIRVHTRGVGWVWRLLCLGLPLSWSACLTVHPLKEEFSRAVLARQPVALDLPDSAEEDAVERFIQKHGDAALPLYRKSIEQFRHTTDPIEELELVAAIEGFAAVEGVYSAAQLRELALDERVPSAVVDAALYQLKKISEDDAIQVIGEMLLVEENARRRRRLVSFLREMSNPGAIPVLNRAMEHELDSRLREEMKLVVQLLQNPNACQLVYKSFKAHSARGEWRCNYRCPGRQPTIGKDSPEECPQTAPLPIGPIPRR